jgi:hypothetical protein
MSTEGDHQGLCLLESFALLGGAVHQSIWRCAYNRAPQEAGHLEHSSDTTVSQCTKPFELFPHHCAQNSCRSEEAGKILSTRARRCRPFSTTFKSFKPCMHPRRCTGQDFSSDRGAHLAGKQHRDASWRGQPVGGNLVDRARSQHINFRCCEGQNFWTGNLQTTQCTVPSHVVEARPALRRTSMGHTSRKLHCGVQQ